MITLAELSNQHHVQFGTSGVRGRVCDLTPSLCYAYTMAFLQTIVPPTDVVMIGHDLRPSSLAIVNACVSAILAANKQPMFVGAVPTPALAAFALAQQVPALMVTGSHIPFDRNGIKFYRSTGEITKIDEQAMLATCLAAVPTKLATVRLPDICHQALHAYQMRYQHFFGAHALTGLRIGIYQHSSVARDCLVTILQQLGAETVALGRSDTFVPIDTEALRPEDIEQARVWVEQHQLDALLSTDGDGDRPLLTDEQGNWLRGDALGVLAARYLQADVVVTPLNSNTALECSGWFQHTIRTTIGSPAVIAAMDAAQAVTPQGLVVGYEANGGFLLGNDIYHQRQQLAALPTRDALLPMLAVLIFARQQQCTLSQLLTQLPARFTTSDRLTDFPAEHSAWILTQLKAEVERAAQWLYPEGGTLLMVDQRDGWRVQFTDQVIIHVRASGNAPELRCYVEADDAALASILCQHILQQLLWARQHYQQTKKINFLMTIKEHKQ